MNDCPCDNFVFPPRIVIPAGLLSLRRQTGTFADFRAALLRAASLPSVAALQDHPLWRDRFLAESDRAGLINSLAAFGQWRGRHPQDFGVMLLEMWAYICDALSFYDEVFANESYLRTARRRESLRRLTALLGYVPRPAVAALVELAAFAEGRRAVTLPAGTAFRSGAFSGHPPQVFELTNPATIHPFSNEWKLLPVRPTTFGGSPVTRNDLLCRPGTVAVKLGDLVLIEADGLREARLVTAVGDYDGSDGEKYVKVVFDRSFTWPADIAVSSVHLLKPSATASLWKLGQVGGDLFAVFGQRENTFWVFLDSIYSSLHGGQTAVFELAGTFQIRGVVLGSIGIRVVAPATVIDITDTNNNVVNRVNVPAATTMVTLLYLDSEISDWHVDNASDIAVHYSFVSAGEIVIEAVIELPSELPAGTLRSRAPIERPAGAAEPSRFQLEDKNNSGVGIAATIDFATGVLLPDPDVRWTPPLVPPVRAFGNIVTASRGETVNRELLGRGDGARASQSFKLKKSPLTYLPAASVENASGLASTLKVYVDGLLWREVPSFFRADKDGEVYIVRANDTGESVVTFGDGERGRRLPTGAQVVAHYRFGAGAAMPPAGSITQLAKPAPGLRGVRNPVAAYGGDDAQPAESLRRNAPRSALLLGRAVSLADFEAVAASIPGVGAVSAEWRWDAQHQRPVAKIWHLGNEQLAGLIRQTLGVLTEPDTPIEVTPATPLPRVLAIEITINPRRNEDDVLAAVRAALLDPENGLLAPERVGIGRALFRSVLLEFLLRTEGALSVTGVALDAAPFAAFGVTPGAGNYFDFTRPGTLLLNGKAAP